MFFGVGRPVIPGIRKPAPDHRPSQLLLHQCFVLLILCILCIDVNCEKNRFPGLPARRHPPPPPHQPSPFGSASATSPSAGSDPLGARASRPHLVPAEACSRAGSWPIAQTWPSTILAAGSVRRLAGAELQCDAPPCWREQHRAMASLPVDPSGGDDRGCARICAGGTPALPGGLHPMRSFHRGHDIAEAFRHRLWWKEVHPYSGLFVLIRVDSWFVFNNDRPFFLE